MDFKYSMEVQRFKPSGKYYDTVSFGTNKEYMYNISEELQEDVASNKISPYYDYLLTGKLFNSDKDHPNGFPSLTISARCL